MSHQIVQVVENATPAPPVVEQDNHKPEFVEQVLKLTRSYLFLLSCGCSHLFNMLNIILPNVRLFGQPFHCV